MRLIGYGSGKVMLIITKTAMNLVPLGSFRKRLCTRNIQWAVLALQLWCPGVHSGVARAFPGWIDCPLGGPN